MAQFVEACEEGGAFQLTARSHEHVCVCGEGGHCEMEVERGFGGWRTSTALDFIIISYYSVSICTATVGCTVFSQK